MKRFSLLFAVALIALFADAQAPKGYYSSAKGLYGLSLRNALGSIITKGHNEVGYKNLEDVYDIADRKPDGTYWDMYSNISKFKEINKGSNKTEGGMMNKEHSFPKSWFGGKINPMYCDAYHVVPADAFVNNKRSNLPFGESSSPTWSSANGFSKVGPCDKSIGYSGTVFEPNDEYKGDFARIYFYMNTRYHSQFSGWSSPMLSGDGYTKWALEMLLRWAKEDPVSQKEIDRNNAVYTKQRNRNPFVDYPGLEEYIWGNKADQKQAFDPDNYGKTDDDTQAPPVPTFDPEGGELETGTKIYIECEDEDAYIYYIVNDEQEQEGVPPVVLTINEATSIKARSGKDGHYSDYVTAYYTVKVIDTDAPAAPTFSPEAGEVEVGTEVTISCEDEDAYIYYTLNDAEDEREAASPVTLTIYETTAITARSGKNGHFSDYVSAYYTVDNEVPDPQTGVFCRVTSADQLVNGGYYLIVCEEENVAMGAPSSEGDIRTSVDVEIGDDGTIDMETGGEGEPRVLTLTVNPTGTWTIYDGQSQVYLALTTDGNKLGKSDSGQEREALWTISIAQGYSHIVNEGYSSREIQYNANHPRFACYTGGQKPVALYLLNEDEGPETNIAAAANGSQSNTLYDLQGRRAKQLQKGVYIIGGKKVIR